MTVKGLIWWGTLAAHLTMVREDLASIPIHCIFKLSCPFWQSVLFYNCNLLYSVFVESNKCIIPDYIFLVTTYLNYLLENKYFYFVQYYIATFNIKKSWDWFSSVQPIRFKYLLRPIVNFCLTKNLFASHLQIFTEFGKFTTTNWKYIFDKSA